MKEQQSVEEIIQNMEINANGYKKVFFGLITPAELGVNALPVENTIPGTQEEKRQVKLRQLDLYKKAYLDSYFNLCGLTNEKVNVRYLMENGFGLGSGDLFDDEFLDELIRRDEQLNEKNEL